MIETTDTRDARIADLERQLQQKDREIAEAKRLKSEFLARMSHDLRTPMNAIIGYTRILQRKLDGHIEARQAANLENIATSANHLLALINDILDLSKVEAGRVQLQPQDVELARLVGECLAAVAPLVRDGVELHQDLDAVPTVRTDPERLKKALGNLLSNAAKYTAEGRISIRARRENGHIALAVSDTGAGIPAADLPHIFDEFRQVARKGSNALAGTGLGLAIVRRSTELIGGQVAVASQEGEGTTFTLTLPETAP